MTKIVIKTLAKKGWFIPEVSITAHAANNKLAEPLMTVHLFNTWEAHQWSAQQMAFHILGEDYIQYDQETFCWTSNEYIHIFTRKNNEQANTETA